MTGLSTGRPGVYKAAHEKLRMPGLRRGAPRSGRPDARVHRVLRRLLVTLRRGAGAGIRRPGALPGRAPPDRGHLCRPASGAGVAPEHPVGRGPPDEPVHPPRGGERFRRRDQNDTRRGEDQGTLFLAGAAPLASGRSRLPTWGRHPRRRSTKKGSGSGPPRSGRLGNRITEPSAAGARPFAMPLA